MATDFARIAVDVRSRALAERVAAEAYDAGAVGLEERETGSGTALLLYAPVARAQAVRAALTALLGGAPPRIESVPNEDWAARWRQGLGPVEVSPRLVIRPSFAQAVLAPGQHELVIDPGQAFGTGTHESTRLVLEWIDSLADALSPGSRILDVGTGSGILALAVLRLASAPGVVLGLDLDPLATAAARDNARANDLPGLSLVTGGLDALAPEQCFDGILANLLRSELEPLVAGIAARLRPGGFAVFAGLLASDREDVAAMSRSAGLAAAGLRCVEDASGESWIALLMRKTPGALPSTSTPPGADRAPA